MALAVIKGKPAPAWCPFSSSRVDGVCTRSMRPYNGVCRRCSVQRQCLAPMRHFIKRKSPQISAACNRTRCVALHAGVLSSEALSTCICCHHLSLGCHKHFVAAEAGMCCMGTASENCAWLPSLAQPFHETHLKTSYFGPPSVCRELNAQACGFGNEGLKLFAHTCLLQAACSW